ncbi:MAG: flotillin-like FloA family protein, partial [Planctomycetes bacterium]|nr:flotillin-like FloA family protein [Planctomycetota bacterium]
MEGIEVSDVLKWLGIALALVIAVTLGIFFLVFGNLWLQAWSSGCPVSPLEFVGMYLRKVPARLIVEALVASHKAGIPVHIDKLQSQALARGNVRDVIHALIAASKANIKLTFERACAIDLAGRDVLDAVKTSVNPKVIDCPSAEMNRPSIDAVAKDGIQLKVKARVTVRTNMDRLVGGATEQTIIARVGEGIV